MLPPVTENQMLPSAIPNGPPSLQGIGYSVIAPVSGSIRINPESTTVRAIGNRRTIGRENPMQPRP